MDNASASRKCGGRTYWLLGMLIVSLGYLTWSGIEPAGRFNWVMETLPAMIGSVVLVATYRWFPLSSVTYLLIWFSSFILMTGGHYCYSEVPIGYWFKDFFHLSRNHFDRFGHFFQGVVSVMVARELLARTSPLKPGKWLFFCSVCIALTASASYELIEWRYAVHFGGKQADDFLGCQNDIWDAQQDMFQALCGAIVSCLTLGRLQSRQIERIGK